MIASGVEIIRWAVQQCEAAKIPPTDAAILEQIRACRNAFAALGYSARPDEQKPQSEREHIALAMCRADLRKRSATLESFYAEVERTWRRYIHEADELIAELAHIKEEAAKCTTRPCLH